MKVDKVCIKTNDDYTRYVCNETWYKDAKRNHKLAEDGARYNVFLDKYIQTMEDLITECLLSYEDITIPEGYKVTIIYNIILTSGNFEPDDRTCTNTRGSVMFSTTDEKWAYQKFNYLCSTHKNYLMKSDKYCCWHSDDFAHNQIVCSYNLCKSYVVEKIGDINGRTSK